MDGHTRPKGAAVAFKAKRVTLRDVAAAAGVAPATVSYVINNTPGQKVRPETSERVRKAIAELGYIPNANARSMRGGRLRCVGVVIRKDLTVPRFAQTLQGIQSRLDKENMSIMLCSNRLQDDGMTDYVKAFLERRIDGVIFLGKDNEGPDAKSLSLAKSNGMPLVIYDCQMRPGTYSSVDLDYEGGARLLIERVLERNPKHLLYLRPDISKAQEEQRERGVREVIAAHPDVRLSVCTVPVTLENLQTWDIRYSIGHTAQVNDLTKQFAETVLEASESLVPGDAVVSSWSTWTDLFRSFCPKAGLIFGELANNGETRFTPGFFTRLPNMEVGKTCADSLLRLLDGKPAETRILQLEDIIDTSESSLVSPTLGIP